MIDVSIILLTKNGEQHLERVLTSLFAQKTARRVEVIVIDSGSTDGTLEIIERFPVKHSRIPPRSFNHGGTRNLGASLAQGAYLVFLSQDAEPADDRWLEHLVSPLDEDEQVAGAYPGFLTRPGCHPMEQRETLEWPLASAEIGVPLVKRAVGNPDYPANPWPYIYFPNTCSCIRRSVWVTFPFKPVNFAEDQDWAKRVLEAGYVTVFVPKAVVLHSHSYPPRVQFRRCYDHGSAMRELFGTRHFPLFRRIIPAAIRDVSLDMAFCKRRGLRPLSRLRWLGPATAWHLAKYAGLWMGTHSDRLPFSVRKRLSLQQRLMEA
ncbi:MAG TPA: glycosyltransferase family 2 protein [Candidatus Methylomirabilis sp.]|nr:glycosyltransferase family 2 protein [Candidatus Methylomirabilis sp.]